MARLTLILLIALISSMAFAQTGTIVLTITGIKADKGGDVLAAIFKEGDFPKTGRQLSGVVKPVTGNTMQVTMENVNIGTYAIAVYQDIDRNKVLSTNFIGFPTEPVGFSNDARIRFGPPSFKDAKITVVANQVLNLNITLR